MKNLCNLLIVAELQIIIKAVFAKSFFALLLTLRANKVYATLRQCREEGAYALENASESREVEPISSDLRSEATEEEGIGSTSRDEDAFSSA